MRIWQQRCPIFTMKIQQNFAFGALWRTGRVLCLCIQRTSTCLMRVAYMGKPMSLVDMDQDNHTVMIVHTIWHEYAPTVVALNAYLHHKVKSTYNHERVTLLIMGVHHKKCTIIHKQARTYTHTCIMQVGKLGKQSKHRQCSKGMAQQGTGNIN